MPLTLLQAGKTARVVTVNGGNGINSRLASMGIYPGSFLTLSRGGSGGPMIVQTGDSRYGLGRGMAHRIMVEPVE